MQKNALVVIDVQNYFVNKDTEVLLNKIGQLIESNKFDYVLFSKFVNNPNSNFHKILDWHDCEKSPDIDVHPAMMKYVTENNVFEKTAFSIFKSEMYDFIKQNDISKISFCGIDIDACVLASAYDGFDLGYNVQVLKEYSLSHEGYELNMAAEKLIRKNLEKAQL